MSDEHGRVLIVEARFYEDVADALSRRAEELAALAQHRRLWRDVDRRLQDIDLRQPP